MPVFYRVGNTNRNNHGLWYKSNGEFSGDIHTKYSFCKSHTLPMPFDSECVGFLSATRTLEELYTWFSREDIIRLQSHGFNILKYESEDYKYHNGHWLINQSSSKLIDVLEYLFT
jgi:hypothetical protein